VPPGNTILLLSTLILDAEILLHFYFAFPSVQLVFFWPLILGKLNFCRYFISQLLSCLQNSQKYDACEKYVLQ